MTTFSELGLSEPLVAAASECKYTQPTEIQCQTIPLILSGQHVLASAETGSGKTAAFALPVLARLAVSQKTPRALVLVPTRELALQVEEQFVLFSKHSQMQVAALYGGTGFGKQIRALRHGLDIIVATPGRLIDCMERGLVSLSQIEILVLDEADRLLDMGFMPQVGRIISNLPKKRQTLMFSATIDRSVERIAGQYMINPVTVKVNLQQVQPQAISQHIYHVNEFGKDALLLKLLTELEMKTVLIFTKTRRKASWVKDRLRDARVAAEEIHGDISQSQREKTLTGFREGAFSVLVATDVAARGLDIPAISHVVNYDLPEAPEDYVHRIGRTGRAGRTGVALSLVSQEQRYLISDIERLIGIELDPEAANRRKTMLSRRLRPAGRRRIV